MKYLPKFEKELSEKRRFASFLTSGVILKSGLSEGRKKGRGRIIYVAEPTNRIVDDARNFTLEFLSLEFLSNKVSSV